MQNILYSILIALSNNIDNVGARIAYCIRGIKISHYKNLWISVITFFIATTASYTGSTLHNFISPKINAIISMILLCCIGLWILVEPHFKKNTPSKGDSDDDSGHVLLEILNQPEKADFDNSKDIDFKEATFLGIALSIDTVGGSFSAGVIGLNSLFVGLLSALLSFIAIWAGNYLTAFFIRFHIAQKATLISGLVLIAIGIKQIF